GFVMLTLCRLVDWQRCTRRVVQARPEAIRWQQAHHLTAQGADMPDFAACGVNRRVLREGAALGKLEIVAVVGGEGGWTCIGRIGLAEGNGQQSRLYGGDLGRSGYLAREHDLLPGLRWGGEVVQDHGDGERIRGRRRRVSSRG